MKNNEFEILNQVLGRWSANFNNQNISTLKLFDLTGDEQAVIYGFNASVGEDFRVTEPSKNTL